MGGLLGHAVVVSVCCLLSTAPARAKTTIGADLDYAHSAGSRLGPSSGFWGGPRHRPRLGIRRAPRPAPPHSTGGLGPGDRVYVARSLRRRDDDDLSGHR